VGYTATQRAGALQYRLESHGFDYHLNLLLPESFQPRYGTRVESAFKRNKYQWYLLTDKGSRCIGLTTSPPSCTNCLEIRGSSTFWKCNDLSIPLKGQFSAAIATRSQLRYKGFCLHAALYWHTLGAVLNRTLYLNRRALLSEVYYVIQLIFYYIHNIYFRFFFLLNVMYFILFYCINE
jgi:hypothetical protein